MGAPHPPCISFGVMRDGTLPRPTPLGAGFAGAGSGAPHGLLSVAPDDQGSNMALVVEVTGAGRLTGAGTGGDFG